MDGARSGVFVDSSGWIALFRANDSNHATADGLLRRLLAERVALVTTNLVLAEVHRFVLHRAGIRPASVALDRIAASRHVRVRFATAEHDRQARRWMSRFADQRWTYTDAVSFAVMTEAKLRKAFTFDRDFVVAGFEVCS